MSRARHKSSKFSPYSMLANERSKMHRAQQQSGFFKPIKPFKLLPGKFDATSILFWIYFFSVMRTGIATHSTTQNSNTPADEEITNLARSRLTYMDRLPPAVIASGICDNIAVEIGILAASNNAFRERAQTVMTKKDFKLVCADLAIIDKASNGAEAVFHERLNAIAVAHEEIPHVYLSHEMIHAHEARLHAEDSNCYIPYVKGSPEAAVPFYPYNEANIKKFEDCMALGDARVENLSRIFKMKMKQEALTQNEEFLLLRAKKELEKTTPASQDMPITIDQLQEIKKQGWPNIKRIQINIGGMEAYVLKVFNKDDVIKLRYQIAEPILSIHAGLTWFEKLRAQGLFRRKQDELAERIAYTQQCLTSQGRRYLYPELNAFLDEQKKLCLPTKNKGISRTEL